MEAKKKNPTLYPIMEQFYTIQGEGGNQGMAAYFIRLGGCDVGCVWCDSKDSWDATHFPKRTAKEILEPLETVPTDFVVITGGEPATYDLNDMVNELHAMGKKVAIETSGVYPVRGDFDWVCFSPKKFKKPLEKVYQQATELKVVIFHPSDLSWAEEHADKVRSDCFLYLQPEWSKKEQILPLIIDYVKKHPRWRISLQTHKYMEIE